MSPGRHAASETPRRGPDRVRESQNDDRLQVDSKDRSEAVSQERDIGQPEAAEKAPARSKKRKPKGVINRKGEVIH